MRRSGVGGALTRWTNLARRGGTAGRRIRQGTRLRASGHGESGWEEASAWAARLEVGTMRGAWSAGYGIEAEDERVGMRLTLSLSPQSRGKGRRGRGLRGCVGVTAAQVAVVGEDLLVGFEFGADVADELRSERGF